MPDKQRRVREGKREGEPWHKRIPSEWHAMLLRPEQEKRIKMYLSEHVARNGSLGRRNAQALAQNTSKIGRARAVPQQHPIGNVAPSIFAKRKKKKKEKKKKRKRAYQNETEEKQRKKKQKIKRQT
jgi:hypothetical protein